jgi:hypothetical protein
MAPQCQALYVSDERRCSEEATNVNGLFCSFHARQVYSKHRMPFVELNTRVDTCRFV